MTTKKVREEETDQAKRFVLGAGRYVDDIKMEGMLHLHVVRSPYARARVLSVSGGITGHEFRADMAAVGEDAGGEATVPFPALATESVNYVGQPVAAVLGKDRYEAEDRAEEVDVQYEPLKPVMDPERAVTAEPIHPTMSSNVASESTLGKDFVIRTPIEIEETLIMARVVPNPLEPRGLVAAYDGSVLTVYASTQSVFSWKEGFEQSLGLKGDQVRVVQMDTGGAFGSKGGIYPEYLVAAYAAMKTKRPIKWTESRYEHLMVTDQGRGSRAKMKLYADRRGRVKGLKADLLVDGGAYPSGGAMWSPRWIAFQLTGPYAVPKAFAVARGVLTNKVNMGPYRGAGRPEAAYYMERMMDKLADETNLDQAEVRIRNAASRPNRSPLGLKIPASRPFLKEAFSALEYSKRRKKEKVGLSCFVLVPAAEGGESAKVAIQGGRVKVWVGGNPQGQGHDVFAKHLVKEVLGVREGLVDYEHADTGILSEGVGSWGSRTAMLGGGAIVEACRKLKAQAKKKLGHSYSVSALLRGEYEAEILFETKEPLNSFGANLVTAKVNAMGMASIAEVVSYYDVGKVLNPSMVRSQITGGSAQALGEVLYERAAYTEDGQLLTATLADSGVPHSTEMPRFDVKTANHRSSLPHGAKGVGESPTIGVPPAAVRALELVLGRGLADLPIESELLWAAPLTLAATRVVRASAGSSRKTP
ncbi:MAG TPA: xanthine dehydrogenase family protein molybdopterin-binding subunit [Nitrososphaerales archaeon]|nr:xanthine dehydrogenase family protein molybdopterin-binding subunit [Nitrososphaerales archaeon]